MVGQQQEEKNVKCNCRNMSSKIHFIFYHKRKDAVKKVENNSVMSWINKFDSFCSHTIHHPLTKKKKMRQPYYDHDDDDGVKHTESERRKKILFIIIASQWLSTLSAIHDYLLDVFHSHTWIFFSAKLFENFIYLLKH